MLELDTVSLNFRSSKGTFDHGVHHVLDAVSFKLYENETLGIIGRNGVGKTTILRIMAGILAPTSGSVTMMPGKTSSLLSIGLGFRADLSGRDNALLAAMLHGSSRKKAKTYLEEIKDFSELGDSFEEPVKTYSSGMRSRLGFTTALLTHVDILLIDEVLSVGDAQFKKKAERAMKERIGGNQTVVFVSHMEAQIQALCDRALWIESGRIMSEGDAASVLRDYNAFINEGRTAHKKGSKKPWPDRRLDKLQEKLALSDEQIVEIRKIRDQGGGRKDIRAVLDEGQQQQWQEARRRRKRRRGKKKRSKGGKVPGLRVT